MNNGHLDIIPLKTSNFSHHQFHSPEGPWIKEKNSKYETWLQFLPSQLVVGFAWTIPSSVPSNSASLHSAWDFPNSFCLKILWLAGRPEEVKEFSEVAATNNNQLNIFSKSREFSGKIQEQLPYPPARQALMRCECHLGRYGGSSSPDDYFYLLSRVLSSPSS